MNQSPSQSHPLSIDTARLPNNPYQNFSNSDHESLNNIYQKVSLSPNNSRQFSNNPPIDYANNSANIYQYNHLDYTRNSDISDLNQKRKPMRNVASSLFLNAYNRPSNIINK
jgi:hypothetical protein